MSLTQHLKDPSSPINAFIREQAPLVARAGTRGMAGKEAAADLGFPRVVSTELISPIPRAVENRQSHAPLIGMALDYRIRLALDPSDEDLLLIPQVGLLKFSQLLALLPEGDHMLAVLTEALEIAQTIIEDRNEAQYDLASCLLASCEGPFRAGIRALAGPFGTLVADSESGEDFVRRLSPSLAEDLASLQQGISGYIESWKRSVDDGARYEPNPFFDGTQLIGGADADWLVGNNLIDCKTIQNLSNPKLRQTLLQLVGYVLLDFSDYYEIREVSILLPRQGLLSTWGLEELLGEDFLDRLRGIRADFQMLAIECYEPPILKMLRLL